MIHLKTARCIIPRVTHPVRNRSRFLAPINHQRRSVFLSPKGSIQPSNEITVYIKGFLAKGEEPGDFYEWFSTHKRISELQHCNWHPEVVGFRWNNGDLPVPMPIASAASLALTALRTKMTLARLTPMGIAASLAADVAIYGGLLATEYWKTENRSAEHAVHLAEHLVQLSENYTKVRVVAHSLGCRLLYHSLDHIPMDKVPHEVHLCAPALTESEVGSKLDSFAKERINVYYNSNDYILSLLYTGITGGSQAIGCAGLEKSYSKVKTVDTSAHFSWLVHTEYRNQLDKFVL